MTKTVFITVGNHFMEYDTSSHVIGVYSSKALAIRAGMKAEGIVSYYVEESDLDSGSCRRIEISGADVDAALKGEENEVC